MELTKKELIEFGKQLNKWNWGTVPLEVIHCAADEYLQDVVLSFSYGDEIEVYAEHGEDEKWWKPAIFYGKSIHKNRMWDNSYVVGYQDGSVDEVTEIRKK